MTLSEWCVSTGAWRNARTRSRYIAAPGIISWTLILALMHTTKRDSSVYFAMVQSQGWWKVWESSLSGTQIKEPSTSHGDRKAEVPACGVACAHCLTWETISAWPVLMVRSVAERLHWYRFWSRSKRGGMSALKSTPGLRGSLPTQKKTTLHCGSHKTCNSNRLLYILQT